MLTEKQLEQIRIELKECSRPLFFFHDDPDGLCSYLLLYRYINEGKGVCVKSTPQLDMKFLYKVEEYQPDKIFVLDLAMVEQEFIDKCKVPIVWIDHHEPQDNTGVKYFNPRLNGSNVPTTYMCYKIVEQDMWIGMVGTVSDWYLPEFKLEFSKEFPDLFDDKIDDIEEALFNTKVGDLVKILSFVIKGKTSDVNKAIKLLTKIKSPYDLLNPETDETKELEKKYIKVKLTYDELLSQADKLKPDRKVVLFNYYDDKVSVTKELSNEVQYKFPNEFVVICREKSGEMKCSLRARNYDIPKLLAKTLNGLDGRGGGHEHACGLVIKKEDFNEFLNRIKDEIQ